jgi:hypothetical protein
MHLSVYLEEAALRRALAALLPITILLDNDQGLAGRWVRLDPVHRLELGVGEGIRLVTSGALRWPFAAMFVTLTAHSLTVMLRPEVAVRGAHHRVLFRPVLEAIDLQHVPDLLERGVVSLVNRALEARGDRLAWDVGRTLALRFVLPETLTPLETAALGVEDVRLLVHADALELTVSLGLHITRLEPASGRVPSA